MSFKALVKFDLNWKICADRLTMPLAGNCGYFSLKPFDIERFVPVLGIVVNNNRFSNANAIANFHTFDLTLNLVCRCAATDTAQRIHRTAVLPIYICTESVLFDTLLEDQAVSIV